MSNPVNRPTHKLFSVCKIKDGKSSWTEIGVAFPHKDGSGEFVMRRDTPRPAQTEA